MERSGMEGDAAESIPTSAERGLHGGAAEQGRKISEDVGKQQSAVSGERAPPTSLFLTKVQPMVRQIVETVRNGSVAVKKWLQRDSVEASEPRRFLPFFVGSIAVVVICILIAGWGRSEKYATVEEEPTADRIQLPDGRMIAYREQGASRDTANRSILVTHGSLSSRIAGIPGVSDKLLEEYGVRLVAYDRPGFGQSDPHPSRTLNTSAQDMAYIADALGLGEKFWVLGYSAGGPHAWAALRYIPNRLAGVAMFAPMGNIYDKNMTKEESNEIWGKISSRRKFMYGIAHRAPSLLPSFMKRTTLNKIDRVMKKMPSTLGAKDRALLETKQFADRWKKDMRESIRQGIAAPHAEEVILQRNWGFKLSDLRPKPAQPQSFFRRVLGLFRGGKVSQDFSGPIHIFQGSDDHLIPAAINEFHKRVLPQIHLHRLDGEGHFSWFCYCDECHREIFKTLFGEVEAIKDTSTPLKDSETMEDTATAVDSSDTKTDAGTTLESPEGVEDATTQMEGSP